MSNKLRFVTVNGAQYAVTERSGYLRADMKGQFGWTCVSVEWAETDDTLKRRIKQARQGGQ